MESRYEELTQALDVLLVCAMMTQAGRWTKKKISWSLDADNFYDAVLCALEGCCDFVKCNYDENSEDSSFYFSDPCMLEYYRLCRTYSSRRGIKLKDNPFMKKAGRYVYESLSGPYTCDYILHTKINREHASGIYFVHSVEFYDYLPLLEKMLDILQFYKDGAAKLKAELAKSTWRAAA